MSEEKIFEELSEEELAKMSGGAWSENIWEEFQREVIESGDYIGTYNKYIKIYGSPYTGR